MDCYFYNQKFIILGQLEVEVCFSWLKSHLCCDNYCWTGVIVVSRIFHLCSKSEFTLWQFYIFQIHNGCWTLDVKRTVLITNSKVVKLILLQQKRHKPPVEESKRRNQWKFSISGCKSRYGVYLFSFWTAAPDNSMIFLVACTRLYNPLCRSVCPLVRRSVTLCFFGIYRRFWHCVPHCAFEKNLSGKSYNCGFFCIFEQYWDVRACN